LLLSFQLWQVDMNDIKCPLQHSFAMVEETWNYVSYCDFTWTTNIKHFNVSYWNKNKIFLVKYSYKLVHHFGSKSTNHPFCLFVQFDTIESLI
jgi:hypothetical protein